MRNTRSLALGALLVSFIPAAASAQREGLKGWVGVAYTTRGQSDRGGQLLFDYPVIESIEPSSPAEKAGLAAGDTILAMNSQDLRRSPMPNASMIQPGQRIVFRFKRNDSIREVTVTVAPRPSGTSGTMTLTMIEQGAAAASARGEGTTPVAARAPMAPGRGERERGMVRTRIPGPPMVTIAPLVFGFGPRTLGVAGAELTELNADLASAIGVRGRGIFVVNVALGTPARESGLRSGDVITRADSSAVSDPGELIRVMRAARDNSIMLRVVRSKKEKTLTLRWR